MKNKKILLFFIFFLSFVATNAQNPSYRQKLYYTCKVWGFVKYFHSNVSVCGVNWDSVLVADLPLVKNAVTKNDFNNALDTMLKAAGPMALTTSPSCDTVPPELSRNLNFGWIKDTAIFRNDVFTILDTIKNNFRPHSGCWVGVDPYPYNYGYLKFGADTLILNIDDYHNYPDEWHRLLELFAHWNIVNYFYPYKYIQNQPWDSTLYQNVLGIDNAPSDSAFYTAFIKITSNMDDAHVEGLTSDNYCQAPFQGFYSPQQLVLKYMPGKYIVAESGVPGLTVGDQIISVNGLTTKQWEDSLRPYLSESDSGSFYGAMEAFMIYGKHYSNMTITYYDSLNNINTLTAPCKYPYPYVTYFPNDTLANVQWRYWSNCNIGYVNIGKMQDAGSDVANLYSTLQNSDAIIFDIRNYPASFAWSDLCNHYLYPEFSPPDVKIMIPNVNYPGTYYWEYQYAGPGSPTPYKGKVIVLFNEVTGSEAEFACMVLGQLPNSVKIGSQTDGTDGSITYYNISQKMGTGFTSVGWFYGNGDSTERIGITPDILMYPTQAGIRQGRDELLEKALQVAGCPTSISTIAKPLAEVTIYPNPSNGIFTLSLSNITEKCNVEIYNVLGEKVNFGMLKQVQHDYTLSLSNEPNGVYFYRVLQENGVLIGEGKVVIQR